MPGPKPMTSHQRAARFWGQVDMTAGASGCWPWQGSLTSAGYGQFFSGNRMEKAHRYAFLLTAGHLPTGRTRGALIVRHSCDNRVCCNPGHLLLGTHADNAADAVERQRRTPSRLFGASNPANKLSEADRGQAHAWRAEGVTVTEIAKRLGVSQSTASRVLKELR